QTETEATGAPQKHHYTLNQQVGSITLPGSDISLIYDCGFYGFYFPPAAYFRRDRWRQPAPAPLITTFP
ncbi:hypothetical protein U2437_13205, partial [Klebsiella pneumoniae]|uniref:hypothetical protein n=1 Tax=Klebsiella pneumoniae TaxID=573 RepID=UPI00379E05C6